MRSLCAAAFVAAAVFQPPSDAEPPVSVVHIDAIAVDARGRPVDTLKASDFVLLENGVPQTLDQVAFVTAGVPEPYAGPAIESEIEERVEASREGTRLVGIFLDEYHVASGDAAAVRRTVLRVLDALSPRDLVAVMKPLDPVFGIRLTRDRAALRTAIETFEGRKDDLRPRTAFERSAISGTDARIDRVRAQVVTSALAALAVHLGGLATGRKAILLVSEGFRPPATARGAELLPRLDTVIRTANRFDVSFYNADPRAVTAHAGSETLEAPGAMTLRQLADETGGRVAMGPGAVATTLEALIRDSSAYYLLTYRSAHAHDGQFRRIDVRVSQPSIELRARKGYWALSPDEAIVARLMAEGPPAPPKPPPGMDEPPHASPFVRSWIGLAKGAAGRTQVTFVWAPVGRVPGERATLRREAAQVVLTARTTDGTTVFEGALRASGADVFQGEDRAAVFEVPPGRLRLRMAIEDEAASYLDTDVRDIEVREFSGGVTIGTPAVLRARTAVEFRRLVADWQAAPVVGREFARSEHLIVRVRVDAQGARPPVAARLLNRLGQPMRALEVSGASSDDGRRQVDLPLGSLAPGEYAIEWSAVTDVGGAKEIVAFRVRG